MVSPDAPTPAPAASRWRLSLLGGVRADGPGTTLSRWPSRACASLLARLALQPRREHPREELAELLWPGAAPGLGRSRLRQVLSTLRGLLQGAESQPDTVFVADRLSVRLVPGALDCDVAQFEHCVAHGDVAGARALYAGELMPGHYEDWVLVERRRLASLFESLPPAPAGTTPVVKASPAADPAAAAPLHLLPSYWTRPFGQDHSLQQLLAALAGRRLLTVLGPGGSGKTRLAVAGAEALQAAADAASRQVLFVPVAEAEDAPGLWRALAQALGAARLLPGGGQPAQVLEALAQQPLLLILDNVEQLDAGATEAIAGLLAATRQLQLLLTSRRRLGLDGEAVFELPGLALPPAEATPAQAAESPAVALFVDRARALRAEFRITPGNVQAVVELVRLLAGMPLAIELAASRLRGQQPAALLQRLRSGAGSPLLDLLARPGVRADTRSRHASMRHVLAWSWRQLTPSLEALLHGLSVPGEPISPAMAEGLAPALGLPAGSPLLALLDEAVETGLLTTAAAQGSQALLYALPPPVREYAAEGRPPALARAVRAALRHWVADQARTRLPAERTALQADLAHLSALLLQAPADNDATAGLALAAAARTEFNFVPLTPELVQAVAAMTDARDQRQPDPLTCAGHELLAQMHHLRGEPAEALARAQRAVATAPDEAWRALALTTRSVVRAQNGDAAEEVQADAAEAERLARRSGNPATLAQALRQRALVAVNYFNDYAAGEALTRETLALHEAAGDVLQARNRRIDLALCMAWMGQEAAAIALLETVIAKLRHDPAAVQLNAALKQLGRVHLRLQQAVPAEAALREAIHGAQASRRPALVLPSLLHLPQAWALRGHAREAALLQGHAQALWHRRYARLNAIEQGELDRNQQRLQQMLGLQAAEALLSAGAALGDGEVQQLLEQVPAP